MGRPWICAKCKRNIAYHHGKVKVGKKVYHARCFQCALCPATSARFYNSKYGKVCRKCYMKINVKCGFCRLGITGAMKKTKDGKYFHRECFKCSHCFKVIKGAYFVNKYGKYQHVGGCKK